MEIKSCEQYVINRLQEMENEVKRLESVVEHLNKVISEDEAIITTYDELFREHGEKDLFNSGCRIEASVCENYEPEYYNFIMKRNEQFLEIKDYRDNKPVEVSEAEG
jgi:hypothetical protein